MSNEFELSRRSGAHAMLATMVGRYEGTSRTWFEPGDPVDASEVKGSLRALLSGRFLLHEYSGTFEGKPMEGVAIVGFFVGEGRWQTAWVNSFHNGTRIMFSESGSGADHQHPNVTGYYPAPPDLNWTWRTTMEQPTKDRLLITHFNISPDGEEVKAVEFDYHRITDQ